MSRVVIDRAVVEQALEALEWHYRQGHSNTLGGFRLKIDEKALRELRAALAQQAEPAQEPVGYLPAYELDRLQSGHDGRLRSAKFGASVLDGDVAVYTAPGSAPPQPAQPEPEPVAWMESPHGAIRANPLYKHVFPSQLLHWQVPLYTAPPERLPLTEEEIGRFCDEVYWSPRQLVRAVERAHGIKE